MHRGLIDYRSYLCALKRLKRTHSTLERSSHLSTPAIPRLVETYLLWLRLRFANQHPARRHAGPLSTTQTGFRDHWIVSAWWSWPIWIRGAILRCILSMSASLTRASPTPFAIEAWPLARAQFIQHAHTFNPSAHSSPVRYPDPTSGLSFLCLHGQCRICLLDAYASVGFWLHWCSPVILPLHDYSSGLFLYSAW